MMRDSLILSFEVAASVVSLTMATSVAMASVKALRGRSRQPKWFPLACLVAALVYAMLRFNWMNRDWILSLSPVSIMAWHVSEALFFALLCVILIWYCRFNGSDKDE